MTPPPAPRRPLPPVFVKFVLAGVASLGVGVASAVVAQPPAASRPTDDALALRVRQALAEDPALRPHKLSLLVNVLDGVAVIGGPVPDGKLTPAIESAAAAVPGVVRVKVSVWGVKPSANPLADRLGEKLSDTPKPTAPAPAVTLTVPGDPPATPDPRPTAGVAARSKPEGTLPGPLPNILQSPVVTSHAQHTRWPGAEPPEYTPIPATNLPTEPVLEQSTPVRAAPPREAEPTRTDSEAWKRDPRFARLSVEVRNGTAVIAGRARTYEAAWELAQEVRTWAGVERVVVGRVEVR